MSDEQQQEIWKRLEGEPLLWFNRFEKFRLMETSRSIAAVFHDEFSKKLEKTRKNPEPDGTWYAMAQQWRWEERAKAWDDYLTAQQEQIIAQERAKVLKQRYALMHKRIEQLDALAQKLIDYTQDEDKIWVPDVKAIGNGPGAERVDLVQFNDALFREIRAHFADIAAELGERVKKSEVNAKVENTGNVGFYEAIQLPRKVPLDRQSSNDSGQEGGDV